MNLIKEQYRIDIMDVDRYHQIRNATRGGDVSERSAKSFEDEWHEAKSVSKSLHSISDQILQPSIKLLLNTILGLIAIDDEMIGSRAKDVECKIISHRKKGKEGQIADSLACIEGYSAI